jgi:peptidoglycan/LPS O-acetylase OafA/YrhL|tara:strand:+ start:1523 stop:2650 length:1128 start_codon:yes stop_codon:yes gene_type:complete
MQQEVKKIFYLESLRGLAALSVAFYHFDIGSLLTNNAFVKNSWLMVDFFFVLSGFVIALNFQSKIYNFTDVINFQARRFFRLYPLHFLMLLIYLCLELGKYFVQEQYGMVANNPAFSINNADSFIQNLFLVQVISQEYLTWNGASWSISAEFVAYFLFAIVILLSQRRDLIVTIFSIMISFTAFLYLFHSNLSAGNGLMRCFYSFFLGVLVFNFRSKCFFNIHNTFSYLMLLLAILAIGFSEPENIIGLNIFVPIIFCILLITLELSNQETNIAINILNHRYLVYLGAISYGIYMIHGLVWWMVKQTLKFIFQFPVIEDSRGSLQVLVSDQLLSSIILLVGMVLIILLSHISYQFLEKPINNFRGKKYKLGGEKN